MADILDTQNALVSLITQSIYPNGTSQAPAQGIQATIFAGWPLPQQLNTLVQNGAACIWVYARPEVKEVPTYPYVWKTLSIASPTLTLTVSGNTVTVGGAMPNPFSVHNLFIILDGQAFNYSIQATDTLASIATALSGLINAVYPGTSSNGAVITLNTGIIPTVRVGTVGNSVLEVGRFEQSLQLCIAASTPTTRATLSAALMPILMVNDFLTMPDGSAARYRVAMPSDIDTSEKIQVYRRDIRIKVEYAITQSLTSATVEAVPTTFINTQVSSIPNRTF